MKRTFIVAFSLVSILILGGCTKNDIIKTSNGHEMEFSTHVEGTTKGSAKVEFKVGDQFALMATQSAAEWTNMDAFWFMGGGVDNAVVVTNIPSTNGTGMWKYNPVKLWPELNKVSFFAYSPVADATNGIRNVTAFEGSPSLDFEVNDDIKSQIDLMRAEALNKFDEEVQLAFSHALTRVTFAAKANVTANQRVRLDKIDLQGIRNSGTLRLYDDTRVVGALDDMGGWVTKSDLKNYSPALTHEVASLVTTDLMAMTAEDQALFMIPQSFTVGGDAKLVVTYSYSNDGGLKWKNESRFEIDLGEYTQHWNPSKNYRYILTLAPENMYTFGATIENWDAEIDVTVTKPISITTLTVPVTGGAPSELVVTETRGLPLGYTIKSTQPTWLKVSDLADGSGAAAEVRYNTDGTVTKAYQMEKKWYIVADPNGDGTSRTGEIEIIRENLDVVKLTVHQVGVANPLENCTLAEVEPGAGSHSVINMVVPDDDTMVDSIKSNVDWIKFSYDGVEANAKERILVTKTGDKQSFYVHTTGNSSATARSGKVLFQIIDAEGLKAVIGSMDVKQKAHTALSITVPPIDVYSEAPVLIGGLNLFKGVTYSVTCDYNSFFSWDGKGDGENDITITPTVSGVQPLYLHRYTNTRASQWSDNIKISTTDDGVYLKQPYTQPGNPDTYVGNFGGKVITKIVGEETQYTFEKALFAKKNDESEHHAFQVTGTFTGANSYIDGKANTEKLQAMADAPAAKACKNGYFLPAQDQIMGVWITKTMGSFDLNSYWSSTENVGDPSLARGYNLAGGSATTQKRNAIMVVRCVREGFDKYAIGPYVIKAADGKVYIDVQDLPKESWSSTSLNSPHNISSPINSLYKKIEVAKTGEVSLNWNEAKTNCAAKGAGWRLPTKRELSMMWVVRGLLETAGITRLNADNHWTGTTSDTDSNKGCSIRFNDGGGLEFPTTSPLFVRCVREVAD